MQSFYHPTWLVLTHQFFLAAVLPEGGCRELPSALLQSPGISPALEAVCHLRLGAIWEGRGWNLIPEYSLTQFQHSVWNRATYWIFLQAWRVIFCDTGAQPEIVQMNGGICCCCRRQTTETTVLMEWVVQVAMEASSLMSPSLILATPRLKLWTLLLHWLEALFSFPATISFHPSSHESYWWEIKWS